MTRNTCSFKLEKSLPGIVCGLDEAGRGPLAGPVVAACVYIPEENRRKRFWSRVNDSKKLTVEQREELFSCIAEHAAYGICQASVAEIDRINILQASMLAMKRAMVMMAADHGVRPSIALVDGNYPPRLPCAVQTVIGGDAISLSIAAASILAKVTRDRMMRELCSRYPAYGWSRNAGYGTPQHLTALQEHGVTDHHRRSFAPVKSRLDMKRDGT
jgi:ribonuclease HII